MKYAVITGAASGIGACVRTRLEAQGLKVLGIDLRGAEIPADLSTTHGRTDAIKAAYTATGGHIDRLVLAAGLGGHLDDGQLVARVNYYGAIEVLDGLCSALASAEGRVVAISSNSAQMRTDPDDEIVKNLLDGTEESTMAAIGTASGALTYGLSKHAVARAVRRRAAEWGKKGITLNAIAPGPTQTPMFEGAANHPVIGKSVQKIPIPKQRIAAPEEIAHIIDFMLSDAADYMHGSIVYVDGGTDAQLRPDSF